MKHILQFSFFWIIPLLSLGQLASISDGGSSTSATGSLDRHGVNAYSTSTTADVFVRGQYFYTAQQLINAGAPAGGGTITHLGWSIFSNTATVTLNNYTVRMIQSSAGPANNSNVTFNFTLSGNQLTVSGITGGLIGPGWMERSGSISNFVSWASWYIVNQVSGTTGGNGVYTLSHSGSGSGTVTSAALLFHHTPMSTVKNAFSYTPVTVNDYAYDLIQLDAPFVWDGVSNVVVDYCFSGRGVTQPTLRTLTAGSSARRATSGTTTRCSSDPTSTSSGSNQIAEIGFQFQSTSCTAPTQNADSLRALSVTSTTASLNWIAGNGAGRVVYINTINSFTAPSTGSNPLANTTYSGGQQCIYNGNATGPLTITGLTANTTYFLRAYEFCTTGRAYATGTTNLNPANFTTAPPPCSAPSTQATTVLFSGVAQTQATLSWTPGNGAGSVVYIHTSSTFTPPVNGSNPGANTLYTGGQQCVFNGTGGGPVTITGLAHGTQYFVRVFEYCAPDRNYQTATVTGNPGNFTTLLQGCAQPTTQASGVSTSAVTQTSASVQWVNGNGSGRVVYVNSVNSFTNPAHGSSPTVSTVYAGGQQCIFNGTGSGPVMVTGLTAGTTYYIRVFEYCAPDRNYAYGTDIQNPGSFSTTAGPGTQVTILDGVGTASGSTHAVGGNNTRVQYIYTASELLANGAPSGGGMISSLGWSIAANSANLALSGYTIKMRGIPAQAIPMASPTVTYSISGTTLTIHAISTNSVAVGQYLFAESQITSPICCPYNYIASYGTGTGGVGTYTLAYSHNTVSNATASLFGNIPAVHPSALTTVKNSFTYTPTPGNNTSFDMIPLDNAFQWDGVSNLLVDVCYTASGTAPTLRTLNAISGRRTTSTCSGDLTGTSSGSNSRAWVRLNFGVQPPPCTAPSVQASGVTFSNISQTSANVQWTSGNGAARIAFLSTSSTFTSPTNGIIPSVNTVYTGGQQCVYHGTGSGPVTVTGLNPSTAYYVHVFEYCAPNVLYTTGSGNQNPNGFTTTSNCPLTTGSNSPVCSGGSSQISLTASPVTGASYSWTGPNGFTSSLQNPIISGVTVNMAGTYTLTMTAPCGTRTDSVTVQVIQGIQNPGISGNSPLCSGATLRMSSSIHVGATYSWSGPGGYTALGQQVNIPQVNIGQSGNYTLTLSVSGCPSSVLTYPVQVNALPVSPSGSNSPVCTGGTLQLSSGTGTGVTYAWSGPSGYTSSLMSPLLNSVTTSESGVYTLILSAPGCGTSTALVSVAVGPTISNVQSGSNTPVCTNGVLRLSATTINGAQYLWSGPQGFTSAFSVDSIVSVGTGNSGIYTLQVSAPGCNTEIRQATVQVLGIPAVQAGGNGPFCSNGQGNLLLTATSVTGGTYTWSGPNGFTSNLQNPSINNVGMIHAGRYTVVVSAACGIVMDSVLVVVNLAPSIPQITTNSPACAGTTLSLSVTQQPGETYQWQGPNGYTGIGASVQRTNSQVSFSGTYTVTASIQACPSSSGVTTVVVNNSPVVSVQSNSPLCTGASLQLSASSILNGQYAWSGPNGFTASSQYPVISSIGTVNAGMYYLTATTACGSIIDSVLVVVAVAPSTPVISTNAPVCSSGFLGLSSNTITGATYSWSGPGGYTATGQFVTRNNLILGHSGNYSLTVSVGNCPTASNQVTIQVLAFPVSISGSNSPVCSGSVLFLTASTVTGGQYLWSGPNGFTSGLQNPSLPQVSLTQAGNYSLTVTIPGCGSSTSSSSVQIGNPVTGLQVSSNTPICQGGTLVLSSQQISGASYLWNGPLGYSSAQAVDSITFVSMSRSGVYTVSASSPGCTSVQATISVNVFVTPTSSANSNTPVCGGNAIYLNSLFISGVSYLWTGPNGFTSSLQNPSISNATTNQSGQYTLVVSSTNCGSAVSSTTVQVGPQISGVQFSSNSPICQGVTLILSSTPLPGASYSWTGPNGFTSSNAIDSIPGALPLNSGVYSLGVSAIGCASITRSVSVTVNASPNLGAGSNSPICVGNFLSLTSNSVSGAQYSWSGPLGFSSNLINPSLTNSNTGMNGIYSLTVTIPNCGVFSATSSVTVSPNPTQVSAFTSSPVCSGGTLQLSSTQVSGMSYQWTGPGGYSSVNASDSVVNATVSGAYSLQVSSPGCANSLISLPVTISPSQTVGAGVVTNPLCTGGVLYLTANSVTGASYFWTGPNGFSSSQQNPSIVNVNITNGGVYSVVMTQPGCGANSSTVTVVVGTNIQNLTPVSNSPVCIGNTLQMSVTPRAGVTYSWTGPNGFTSNQNNVTIPNVVQTTAGNYTLILNSPGCNSASYSVKVIISNPGILTAGNNGPVCGGSNLNLTASGLGTYTYQWTGPAGYSSNLQNPVLSNAQNGQSGIYSLVTTVPNCGSYTMTTSVQIGANLNGVIASSNSPICANNTLNLSGTTITGASYAWLGPNGFSSNVQFPVIPNASFGSGGIYSLTFSTPGCNAITRTHTVIVNPALVSLPGSNSPVCQGGAVYFSSNSLINGTYSWSGPNGFTSTLASPSLINAQPISSGTYTLTVSQPSCGSATGTTVIQVGTNLSTVSLGSNSPTCVGNTLTLSCLGMTNGSVIWVGPGGFTSNLLVVSRSPVQSPFGGTYTATITSPGCGTQTRTTGVSVTNISIIPGSNSPICQGGVLQLSSNNIAGASYSWTGPLGFSSFQQNPSVSNAQPTRTGMYTLSVTTPVCGVLTTSTSVLVSSSLGSLAITSNSPVCVGNNLNLTVTNRTGFTFNWTGPNGFTSTLAQPVVSPTVVQSAGRYTVAVISAGCGSTTVQSNVMVVNNPASVTASGTTPVCRGSVIYFNSSAPTGSTRSWSGPAGFASTSVNPSRSNAQLNHSGIYTMNATVPGCGVVSRTVTVTVNNCREGVFETAEEVITELKAFSFEVYPNPTEGKTKAKLILGANSESGEYQLTVMDVLGHVVLMSGKQLESNGEITWDLDFSQLAKGLYLVKLNGVGVEEVERVVVR